MAKPLRIKSYGKKAMTSPKRFFAQVHTQSPAHRVINQNSLASQRQGSEVHLCMLNAGKKGRKKKTKCHSLQRPPFAPKLNNCIDQSGD